MKRKQWFSGLEALERQLDIRIEIMRQILGKEPLLLLHKNTLIFAGFLILCELRILSLRCVYLSSEIMHSAKKLFKR